MKPARHHNLRAAVAVAIATVAALVLTGCGAPEYQYPKSAAHNLYFKVPSTWQALDQRVVDAVTFGDPSSVTAQQKRAAGWAAAYDASGQPDARHLLLGLPSSAPAVRAFVLPLDADDQSHVSFDFLRDFFLPVSDDVREQVAANPNFTLTDFELVGEQLIRPEPGFRGLRVVYSYRLPQNAGGDLQTFDQLMLTNDATDLIYGLLIQCSATCYLDHQAEIQDVVSSFTVRSK
jgi:hypothetical protein